MRRRICGGWLAFATAVVVVALAGCGGGETPDAASSEPTDTTEVTETVTSGDTAGGAECDGVSALATAVGPTLRVTADEAVTARSDDFRNASAALSEYASQASADLQSDISTVSTGWDAVAGRLY
jgi:hypothetical protein